MTTGNDVVVPAARSGKRTRLVRPYPVNTLEDALEVARAIRRTTSGYPIDRGQLAKALGTTVSSSGFTTRLNSAARYGLTEGAYNDPVITLTPTGEAITAPQAADERHNALVDAAIKPVPFRRFYEMFHGRIVPEVEYARNLIQRELEIHPDLAGECLELITKNGIFVDILKADADGAGVVDLGSRAAAHAVGASTAQAAGIDASPGRLPTGESLAGNQAPVQSRIFVGHAGPSRALDAVRDTLSAFNIRFVESDASVGGGLPVPPAVAREMRSCTAGVLIFEAANFSGSSLGYQLGGASVLFGEKVIVLEEAVTSDSDREDLGGHRMAYEPDRPGRLGLDLLKVLVAAGVVSVTA